MADKYRIIIPSDNVCQIRYGDVHLIHSVSLDGLVSDKRSQNLSGKIGLIVSASKPRLAMVANIGVVNNEIRIGIPQLDMEVVRQLAEELVAFVGFDGEVFVEKTLPGNEDQITVFSSPSVLSNSVYVYLSDVAAETLDGLALKSLDELTYREVE